MDFNLVKEYARDVEELEDRRHQQLDSEAPSAAPDSATAKYMRKHYTIWNGKFIFDIGARDSTTNSAWVAGKRRKGHPHAYQFWLPDRS
jgi:hypothetical protein